MGCNLFLLTCLSQRHLIYLHRKSPHFLNSSWNWRLGKTAYWLYSKVFLNFVLFFFFFSSSNFTFSSHIHATLIFKSKEYPHISTYENKQSIIYNFHNRLSITIFMFVGIILSGDLFCFWARNQAGHKAHLTVLYQREIKITAS